MESITGSWILNRNLQLAIESGSYERTLAYLIQGAEATHVCRSSGLTAVGTAARFGNTEILELLLQSCEEPDLYIFNSEDVEIEITPEGMDCLEWEDEFEQNSNDTTNKTNDEEDFMEEFSSLYRYYAKTLESTGSLIAYIRENNISAKRILDAHTPDANLKTPLHYAAEHGHVKCARILLMRGAKVNSTDNKGRTPLHFALKYDDVVKLLLEYGANVNIKEYNTGNTPMHLALKDGNSNAAKAIMETNQLQINETNMNAETYVICAIKNNNSDIASELVQNGALLNWQDKNGRTALYYSVTLNNISCASALLKRGARIISSHYLLHYCVLQNMVEMLELFLSYDPYFNGLFVRNFHHFEPLPLAVFRQRPHIVVKILELVYAKQPDLLSLLRLEHNFLLAAQFIQDLPTFVIIARSLISYSYGAALQDAIDPSILNLYHSRKCNSALGVTLLLHKFNIVEFLLIEGANVGQIASFIKYLMLSVPRGSLELLTLLIQMGYRHPRCDPERMPNEWSNQRRQIELELYHQYSTPLSLQVLTRNAIRKRLLNRYFSSNLVFRKRFRCTLQKSSLQLMIEQLNLPIMLQKYLLYFANYDFT